MGAKWEISHELEHDTPINLNVRRRTQKDNVDQIQECTTKKKRNFDQPHNGLLSLDLSESTAMPM